MAVVPASGADIVTIFNAMQQHDCPPKSCDGAYVIERGAAGFEARRQPGQHVVDIVADVGNDYLRLVDEGTGGGSFVLTAVVFRVEGKSPLLLMSANSYDGPAIYSSTLYLARYDRGRFLPVPGLFPHLRPHNFVADVEPTYESAGGLKGAPEDDMVSDPRDEEFIAYVLPRRGGTVDAYLIRFDSTACVKANWLSQPPSRREDACSKVDEKVTAMREIRFDRQTGRFAAGPRKAGNAPGLLEHGK